MSSFQAFQISGFGRLVVCDAHATDVWMWLWMETDSSWQLATMRANERRCAVCTAEARCPAELDAALARQGRAPQRHALKRAA